MRDLEFRAWDGSEFIYLGFGKGQDIWKCGSFEVIEQYTGLKDKNVVKIFEGDILDCKKHSEYVRYYQVVVFDSGHFKTENKTNSLDFLQDKRFEVIGNIHQNPELLGD